MTIRLFRFHKGSLEDSLKTVEEVSSKKDIKKTLEKTDRHFGQNVYTERKHIKCPECGEKIYLYL